TGGLARLERDQQCLPRHWLSARSQGQCPGLLRRPAAEAGNAGLICASYNAKSSLSCAATGGGGSGALAPLMEGAAWEARGSRGSAPLMPVQDRHSPSPLAIDGVAHPLPSRFIRSRRASSALLGLSTGTSPVLTSPPRS